MSPMLLASFENLNQRRSFVRALPDALRKAGVQVVQVCAWVQTKKAERLDSRRLRLIETISLGEKRFVAVLQIDKQEYLVGVGTAGIALLAKLDGEKSFGDTLREIPNTKKPPQKPRARKAKSSTGESA